MFMDTQKAMNMAYRALLADERFKNAKNRPSRRAAMDIMYDYVEDAGEAYYEYSYDDGGDGLTTKQRAARAMQAAARVFKGVVMHNSGICSYRDANRRAA